MPPEATKPSNRNLDKLQFTPEAQMKLYSLLGVLLSNLEGKKGEDGKDGVDGKDGHTPTDEELIALILPLIPEPLKGEKGEDGRDAQPITDDELIALITPLIPKAINGKDGTSLITTKEELVKIVTPLIPAKNEVSSDETKKLIAKLKAQISNLSSAVTSNMVTYRVDNELVSNGSVLNLKAGSGVTITSETTSDGADITINAAGGQSDTFETVSKNLDASGATLSYTGEALTSIAYTNGINKTLNYTGDNLTSVVLSGSTPNGIALTKTLSYTGDNLTGVTYS